MKISIITVFPEIHQTFLSHSLIARAIEKNIITVNLIRFSDMCEPKERIDEPTVGHGAGMIIKPEVVEKALNHCENSFGKGFKIFFSPQGQRMDQVIIKKLATKLFNTEEIEAATGNSTQTEPHIILVCSRYEGIDARVEEAYADLTLSIGDYVIMGGDLAAQVFMEAILRYLPNVVGRQESVEKESFSNSFLDHPEYGQPVEWKGLKVPEILLSGNHGAVDKWRNKEAARKTVLNRFDWFANSLPSNEDLELAKEFIPPHYVALMHSQVMVKDKNGISSGNTSIASLDIHDSARSGATYGIKNTFIVSKLEDQQKIMQTFLGFWESDKGKDYNASRHFAVSSVIPTTSLNNVIETIEKQNGKRPLLIATSAKPFGQIPNIDFFSQGVVWSKQQPVLFIFGTGQGLSDEVLNQCDFMLLPINGLTKYNHLSVRSAISIVLDRWLGLHPKLR